MVVVSVAATFWSSTIHTAAEHPVARRRPARTLARMSTTELGADYASVDHDDVDQRAAVAAGIRFAIVRASYSTHADPTHQRDVDGWRAAGAVAGAYMFEVFDAGGPSPRAQVEAFIPNADIRPGVDLPPVLDVEFPRGVAASGLTREQAVGRWREAYQRLRDHYGVPPMVYSSARVIDGHDTDALAAGMDVADLDDAPLWLARYPIATRRPPVLETEWLAWPRAPVAWGGGDNFWVHQYQGDAVHVPGFSRTVDLNRFHPLADGAGPRAAWVQRRLQRAGTMPIFTRASGAYDDQTRAAVRLYQVTRGLSGTGVVDLNTFVKLAWTF